MLFILLKIRFVGHQIIKEGWFKCKMGDGLLVRITERQGDHVFDSSMSLLKEWIHKVLNM